MRLVFQVTDQGELVAVAIADHAPELPESLYW